MQALVGWIACSACKIEMADKARQSGLRGWEGLISRDGRVTEGDMEAEGASWVREGR